ncbi:dynamin family protein [Campylobacter concisus]|uniref:Putative ATP n=1 Tax=Campylobacter concisus ATCC 51562 TaxID=1242969 RepID=U2F5W6_9BACT|nr:dynamin family protein [Campylobacter concisus]ERJ25325.1 Putative ATP [Campylobacter concisus ATCC 51562]
MFNEFINAYKARYFKVFTNDFKGELARLVNDLNDPSLHISEQIKESLNLLIDTLNEPPLIAVIGQFSSGKSTFLNALLGQDILPSGLTPVTAKAVRLKFAKMPLLSVKFINGSESLLASSDLAELNKLGEQVSGMTLYAPSEILKEINFIDTPGLNSLRDADTKETKNTLKKVSGTIWLSLANNAAKASELESIKEILKANDLKAICLINQKDKLSEEELESLLKHARQTYGELFEDIIAISSKQALLGITNNDKSLLEASNFNEALKAIKEYFLDKSFKENFIKARAKKIVKLLTNEQEKHLEIYDNARLILDEFNGSLDERLDAIKEEFKPKIALRYSQMSEVIKLAADEVFKLLKPFSKTKFNASKTLLNKEIYKRENFEVISLDSDEVFSKLIYEDVVFNKFFKRYKKDLKELENAITSAFNELYKNLEDKFLIYKSRYENYASFDDQVLAYETKSINTYAGRTYENFLREYETAKFKAIQKVSLFFEKLDIKLASNYENALKLAVYFIKQKIEKTLESHLQMNTPLYIPSAKDVYERMLDAFSLYEFEALMCSNSSFLNKILLDIKRDFNEIYTLKIAMLDGLKERVKEQISKIEELCENSLLLR